MPDNSTENQPPAAEEIAIGGGGTAPESIAGGSGGVGGGTFTPRYGRRTENIYNITEDELGHLFFVGLLTTLCFSIATFCLAVAFNIYLALSLAQALPDVKVVYWTTLREFAKYISLFFLAVGIFLVFFGRNRINRIKSRTEFPVCIYHKPGARHPPLPDVARQPVLGSRQ